MFQIYGRLWFVEKITIFHRPHFKNGLTDAVYPQSFIANIMICHENICYRVKTGLFCPVYSNIIFLNSKKYKTNIFVVAISSSAACRLKPLPQPTMLAQFTDVYMQH